MSVRSEQPDSPAAPALRAVFLDIGETLIDETRIWGEWADWLGVPRLTFFAVLGSFVERGEPHTRVLEAFRPGFDLAAERARRGESDLPEQLLPEDLYPDAVDCLGALRAAGLMVGIAGNQPASVEAVLRSWDLPVDVIATSEGWGVDKPSPEFFERVVTEAGVEAGAVAYVGDRVDNDVVPAARAGLRAVFIRRGPWGHIQAERPDAAVADIAVESLAELPGALSALRR